MHCISFCPRDSLSSRAGSLRPSEGKVPFAQENAVPPWESQDEGGDLELLLPLTRLTVTRLESENLSKVSFWVSISLTWGVLSWGQLKGRWGGSDPDFPWANPCTQVFQSPKVGCVAVALLTLSLPASRTLLEKGTEWDGGF